MSGLCITLNCSSICDVFDQKTINISRVFDVFMFITLLLESNFFFLIDYLDSFPNCTVILYVIFVVTLIDFMATLLAVSVIIREMHKAHTAQNSLHMNTINTLWQFLAPPLLEFI